MAKIGILGGTFDPVHNGHLALGKQAYEQFKLDEIWLSWQLRQFPILYIPILN